MASTTPPTRSPKLSSQPAVTWGELCAALEAGLLPATVANGAYVVRAHALRRLSALESALDEEATLFAKPRHEDVDQNPSGGHMLDALPRR